MRSGFAHGAPGKRSRKKRWRNTASTAVSPVRRSATHSSRACTANPTSRTAPAPLGAPLPAGAAPQPRRRNPAGRTGLQRGHKRRPAGNLPGALRRSLPHRTHGADRRIRRAGRPFDTGQQLFGIQLPVHRGNRSALQPQPGHGRRHQPALHPLCQNERRPHGRRPRGSCPLCRTEAGFPLQDRRGRPLLPGVPAPRIHLGRPLEKPEGLPAFREKATAARKPQHCAGRPPAVISGRQRSIRNRSRVFRDSIRPVRDNTKAPDLSRSGAFFPSGIPGFSGDRIILRRRVFPSAKNCRTRP